MWSLPWFGVVTWCLLYYGVSSQTVCEKLTADNGTFTTLDYPNEYPDDSNCTYEISVTPPKVIRLTFMDFDIEYGYDNVHVYDGNTTDSILKIATLTGRNWIPDPLISSGSFMTVQLVSDELETWRGFQAKYVAEDKVLSECEHGQWRCANGVACIEAWKRCNGNIDCTDSSDEDANVCVCQDIPSSLSMCRGLEYKQMTLPNPLNYSLITLAEVQDSPEFKNLSDLAYSKSDCHARVRDFVCATLVPRCESSPKPRQLLPCRSWCEEVMYWCREYEASAFNIPSCAIFPDTNCNNVETTTTLEGENCFDGNGANYRGHEARGSVTGQECEPWDNDPTVIETYPWANLVDNKCRNHLDDYRPFCYTPSGFEYCDVIPCNTLGCKDPGNPRFGKRRPVLKYYWPDDRITFTCDTGFKFKDGSPPDKSLCVVKDNWTEEADWNTPKPNCEVDEKFKLQMNLLDGYNSLVSPLAKTMTFKAYVVNIVNLDEKAQQIVTSLRAEFTWNDHRLEWEKQAYGWLDHIFVGDDQVWKPTLTLERNADPGYRSVFPETEVKLEETGEVTWPIELLTTTTCTLDPFLFPQDNMTCAVCWRAGEEYTIGCSSSTTHRDGNFLTCYDLEADIVTGEWSGKTTLSAKNNTACLTLTLKRDPTYHYATTISPCLILIILMIITFIMPIDKGDRIGFGVTVLLSMVVSLVVVTGFLPVSSTLPFIAMLIIVCMALMALFMLTTLFIIIIHDKKGPVPKWARTLFLKHLARALLMGDLTKKAKTEEPTTKSSSNKGKDIEGNIKPSFMMNGDDQSSGSRNPPLIVKNECVDTDIGLKASVDELKVSVKQLSGSIDALARGSDGDIDEEVGEYALLADVLDRLSLVLYLIAIAATVPCTLLFGRPRFN
ncbi:uncharacterized protein LOC144875096 isoform X2 [Branchiostoma floridae x Branchiostoma japonicum]